MLPTVFLSLEGGDELFVDHVRKFLPDGLAYFYPRSFANGEDLLKAMEDRVGQATMFVLFASKNAVKSPWVGFEVDQARLAKIKDPTFRIIVVPIGDVSFSDLPPWMRGFWVTSIGRGAREVARYIRRALITGPLSRVAGSQVFGRGALVDASVAALGNAVLKTEQTPNVFVLAGTAGIGRRTFGRRFLAEGFPATPELNFGPELQLPQFADLADLYRALRQEIETDLKLHSIGQDLQQFRAASLDIQADEVARRIGHFGRLGQAVTVVTGNGIYEDKGFLKPWVPVLFRELERSRDAKLLIVSNRLVHENELRAHPNVLQLQVPPLAEQDIRSLMIQAIQAFHAKVELPNSEIIRIIGGHAGIARATAALVSQQGPAFLNTQPADVFGFQEEVLGEALDFERRSVLEKDILSVLSWVPQLSGEVLRKIIVDRHQVTPEIFGENISGLILACLVEVSGGNYLITGPIRSLFRRKHGYGSSELMKSFSEALDKEWERAKTDDVLRAELVDAIAYMAAIEGGTLPEEFRDILLPSTLQEVVHDTYDRSHDDPQLLKRVVSWGLPALKGNMDETTREEILSYVVRAQARLGDESGAEQVLKFIDGRNYRSRYYLRAFYDRVHRNDMKSAISNLLKARPVKKYIGQVIGDLARCYQQQGQWRELQELVKTEEQYIGRNAILLDVQIGMRIAQGDFVGAEQNIRALRTLPRQNTYADGRTAMVMMRRDLNFVGAQQMLTDVLQRGAAGNPFIRGLRAIAAAEAGDSRTAREDAEFLKTRNRLRETHSIEARIKLGQHEFDGALTELAKNSQFGVTDHLLRARILEGKADAAATPFSEREGLRKEASELRQRYRMLDEYEVNR
ncbi:toll/interleukin-1 receptor domain-containing protein [Novosphingobium sp. fls2-241-R2A-195]|uniref:toll/interleukin-1 receptor domain-containing protein n=1 Tax=Novosphingobium sp. fls2-241-R2A-195 TaxID=3040296 RepID=UPI00254E605F|nr:toll/interleukin-1 receptor domain-containing protein [Novosphingobium sp. fls2-241-R2A-195]